MKTAEAMEKMRRIEGRVATDQVCSRTYSYNLDTKLLPVLLFMK